MLIDSRMLTKLTRASRHAQSELSMASIVFQLNDLERKVENLA